MTYPTDETAAHRWAYALADARPIPYVLTAPTLLWPTLLWPDVAAGLPALNAELIEEIRRTLSTVEREEIRIVLRENDDPAETYAFDLVAVGNATDAIVAQFDDAGRGPRLARARGTHLAAVLGIPFADEVPE